jgi:hypothetical protein
MSEPERVFSVASSLMATSDQIEVRQAVLLAIMIVKVMMEIEKGVNRERPRPLQIVR